MRALVGALAFLGAVLLLDGFSRQTFTTGVSGPRVMPAAEAPVLLRAPRALPVVQATPRVSQDQVPASVYAACGAGIAFVIATAWKGGAAEPARSVPARSVSARMNARRNPALRMTMTGYENELGATGPLGYWDPLGLSEKADAETFRRWRATELKHGRIAMMATTGYIVQEFLRWPGYLSTSEGVKFADLPNGIKAWAAIPDAGKLQVIIGILLMEGVTWKYFDAGGPLWAPGRKVPEGKEPGDVAGDVWVRYTDPVERANKLNIELNNGRAAMMGITGMLMHDHITGSWIPPGF